MGIQSIIDQFESDYADEVGPFDPSHFPEATITDVTDRIDRPRVLTYMVMLDYNRSADMLTDNIRELYADDPRWFDPEIMAEQSVDTIASVLSDTGFRYPNRDARAWVENSQRLAEYGRDPVLSMLQDVDYDATELVELLNEDGYLYLKGDKLAPFYARVMHQHVTPLDGLHELPIPVDTHIRRLTQDLCNTEMSDDEIRAYWADVTADIDSMALAIDRYLWLIGYNWGDGGEDYWSRVKGLK